VVGDDAMQVAAPGLSPLAPTLGAELECQLDNDRLFVRNFLHRFFLNGTRSQILSVELRHEIDVVCSQI
jgi:hypothetical protein